METGESTTRHGRRLRLAASFAALALAVGGTGGLVLPRLATSSSPASLLEDEAPAIYLVKKCDRKKHLPPPASWEYLRA